VVLFFACRLGERFDQWSTGLKFTKHRSAAESRTTNSQQRALGGKRSTPQAGGDQPQRNALRSPQANASPTNTPDRSPPRRVHTGDVPARCETRRDDSPIPSPSYAPPQQPPKPHDACHRSKAHRSRVAANQTAPMVGFGRDRSRCWMVPFPKGSRFRIVLRCWNSRSLRYAKRRFKEWPVLLKVVQPIEDLVPTASA